MSRLVSHGFLDIELDDSLANICNALPRAAEIARVGKIQEIQGEPWRFLDRPLSITQDGRALLIGWHIGSLHREGTYGKIYRAHRMVVAKREDGRYDVVEAPHEIILKQTAPPVGSQVLPTEDIRAHTSEALLHILAWRTIQHTATPWAIPRPFEVFGDHSAAKPGWLTMSLCMSYVRGRTIHSYMEKYWRPDTPEKNTEMFLGLLAQTAYILYHLQAQMRLNHRDVKVNNLLIRARKEPLRLELAGLTIEIPFELTLIDFGFACVGCPPPKQPNTVLQAGSWFPLGELCCKAGRDLAQLIFCIHCYFPLDRFLTLEVYSKVHQWMQFEWSGGICDGLHGFTKEGRPRREGASGSPVYDTGIYEFLRRPEVDPVTCEPITIFRACADLNRQISRSVE